MLTAHLKKLRLRTAISAAEEEVIRRLVSETREVGSDQLLVKAGETLDSSILLLDGWIVRSKDLATGQRQVTEVHIAGDFVDLHGFTLKQLDHDLVTASDCTIAIVPHERLVELTERHPHLARAYWLMTNLDASITREMALSLGQRPAISRMAHLFCELHLRLEIVGKTRGDSFDFPLTQREIAECLGLTVVHVNRTLQALRKRGLVEAGGRQVTILDRAGLESVADFDPAYLHLDKRSL